MARRNNANWSGARRNAGRESAESGPSSSTTTSHMCRGATESGVASKLPNPKMAAQGAVADQYQHLTFPQIIALLYRDFKIQTIYITVVTSLALIACAFTLVVAGRMTCGCNRQVATIATKIVKDRTLTALRKTRSKLDGYLVQLQDYATCPDDVESQEMVDINLTEDAEPVGTAEQADPAGGTKETAIGVRNPAGGTKETAIGGRDRVLCTCEEKKPCKCFKNLEKLPRGVRVEFRPGRIHKNDE